MLQVKSLGARRGARLVFRHISFALDRGDALVVKGVNGSGKSSLLRAIAGLLAPSQGEIVWDRTQGLHYIGHRDALKPDLTVQEMFDYEHALYPTEATPAFRDIFGINDLLEKPIRYLSAGQRRRVALSRLGLYDASLWLLDEPTTALDAQAHVFLMNIIAQHRAAGGIAIIATHHDVDMPGAQILHMKSAATL